MAGLGALLQSSIRQTRLARPDVRVGMIGLDPTDPALLRQITRIGIEFACSDAGWTSVSRLTAAQASGK